MKVRRISTNGRITVRLIGIDAPETRKPGTPVQCGGAPERPSRSAGRIASNGNGRLVKVTSDPNLVTDNSDLGKIRAGWAQVDVYETAFNRCSGSSSPLRSALP